MPSRAVKDDPVNVTEWLLREQERYTSIAAGKTDPGEKKEYEDRAAFIDAVIQLLKPNITVLACQRDMIARYIDEIFGKPKWQAWCMHEAMDTMVRIRACA